MDNATLKALKDSIAKWEGNTRVDDIDDALLGHKECPLCILFWSECHATSCNGCPVKDRTGYGYCSDTPFDEVCIALDLMENDGAPLSDFHKAARAEVDFLKSLLPEEQV